MVHSLCISAQRLQLQRVILQFLFLNNVKQLETATIHSLVSWEVQIQMSPLVIIRIPTFLLDIPTLILIIVTGYIPILLLPHLDFITMNYVILFLLQHDLIWSLIGSGLFSIVLI